MDGQMSFTILPSEIVKSILSFRTEALDLIRQRRVCKFWKNHTESIKSLSTEDEIEGNLLTYFPNLESYQGSIDNLTYLEVSKQCKLLSLTLTLSDSHSTSLFFGIIRDYYRAGLASKLQASTFVNLRKGTFNFNAGLFTFDKWSEDVKYYAAIVGKQAEIHVLDGDNPFCVSAKHVIYHANGTMATAWMTDLISYEDIEQLTIYLTDSQLEQLKSWMPQHLMKKVRFIVGAEPHASTIKRKYKMNRRGASEGKILTGKDEMRLN